MCVTRYTTLNGIMIDRADVSSNTFGTFASYLIDHGGVSHCSGIHAIDSDTIQFFYSDEANFITYSVKFRFST